MRILMRRAQTSQRRVENVPIQGLRIRMRILLRKARFRYVDLVARIVRFEWRPPMEEIKATRNCRVGIRPFNAKNAVQSTPSWKAAKLGRKKSHSPQLCFAWEHASRPAACWWHWRAECQPYRTEWLFFLPSRAAVLSLRLLGVMHLLWWLVFVLVSLRLVFVLFASGVCFICECVVRDMLSFTIRASAFRARIPVDIRKSCRGHVRLYDDCCCFFVSQSEAH